MTKTWLLIFAFAILIAPLNATSNEHEETSIDLFSADDYRTDRYRSPTPKAIGGVQTVDTAKIRTMLKSKPSDHRHV
jgi:hypothetical protein